MGELERDDAMGRLGGTSKLAELEQKVIELERSLNGKHEELEAAVQRNRVHVGRQIDSPTPSDFVVWYDESGTVQTPVGICRIEGLGDDWCVIRSDFANALYFTADPSSDIRERLGPFIID